MIRKPFRTWVSSVAIAAVVFGQLAASVHACQVVAGVPAIATTAAATADPCADMGTVPADAPANSCETHCSTAAVTPAQTDLPVVVLAALPTPAFSIVAAHANDGMAVATPAAVSRAPPLTLQFCRLLI